MAEETVLPTLHNCVESKEAWLHLLTPQMRGVFFEQDFHSCLRFNLCAHKSFVWARYYNKPRKQPSTSVHRVEQDHVWPRPPFGLICLNVDMAVSPNTGMGSAGGLFRDNDGRWLMGFNKFLGITSPLFAKLWVIYISIKVAWDNGFEYVQVQSDCLDTIKLLLDPNRVCSSLSLVRAIDLYRRKCWLTEITWIPCDANKPTDNLAKSITSLPFVVSILEESPDYLRPMLAEDTSVSLY
ncbi:hypothetical protein V6N12_062502 [Hibiscus sabdariffa]|uniref:RNase H type-1 domain-containing protein n=1 Tax=Hibiscus sabdariffa TaxID=183260 RepID=A0ABR2F967_9ROSI